jgi:AcrR family transcriptional regulator
MNVNKRKRRTPEEARTLILDTAERRLAALGLEGLHIVGVSHEAGISHATLIHHFGSSDGMRRALIERMTERLISDAVATLEKDAGMATLFRDLFAVFTTGGHARLLAWLALDDEHREPPSAATRALFDKLIQACAEQLPGEIDAARNVVILVVSAAIGIGVAGEPLNALVGMDARARKAFPEWLASRVGILALEPPG